jgi:hypothetical protein
MLESMLYIDVFTTAIRKQAEGLAVVVEERCTV